MSNASDGRTRPNQVSTRLPDPVLRAVDDLAAKQDRSRSDVIAALVAQSLEMPQAVADRQVDPKLVADAMGRGDFGKQIAAVKTVGAQVFEFDPAGALIIWRYAADLRYEQEKDRKAQASELRHTAARAANETVFSEAAVVLAQRAFDLDPDDPRAASLLGQDLHKAAQKNGDDPEMYRQAANVLRHADVDQYARHFLAWCELHIARHEKNEEAETAAQDALIRVFREWSYNASEKDRQSIVRQLKRLPKMYGNDDKMVQRALDATALGPWSKKITIDEVVERPRSP
jgi:predicted transcriptional regulator